ADGNGRTARLVEFHIQISSGMPTPATHLLSNFYNLTRTEYYRQLDFASKSRPRGNPIGFLCYAVQGLRDQLREQIAFVRKHQMDVAWINYIHEVFAGKTGTASERQRHLVFDLWNHGKPVPTNQIEGLTPRLAKHYASLTTKTLLRDLNALVELQLLL